MAAIKFSALISEIKGSLNGSTIQGGRSSSILRNKPLPDQRSFIASGPQKSTFLRLVRNWRLLTQSQRNGWDSAATSFQVYNKFGDLYTPSGFQLYVTLNLNRYQAVQTYIDNAPSPVTITTLTKVVAQLNLGIPQFLVNLTYGTVQPNTYFFVYASKPVSPGVQVSYKHFNFVEAFRSTDLPQVDIYNSWLDTGVTEIPIGQKVFVRVRMVRADTGQVGPIVGTELFVSL